MKRTAMKRSWIALLLVLLLVAAASARAQEGEGSQPGDAAAQQAAGDSAAADAGESEAVSGEQPAPEESAVDAAAGDSSAAAAGADAAEQDADMQRAESKHGEGDRATAEDLAAKLVAELRDAIQTQEHREEVADAVWSQLIGEAPSVELANGDGDVATTGKCSSAYDAFCADVQPGEGRLAECLTDHIQQQELGNTRGLHISSECIAELEAFMVDRATNINKDVPLAQACRRDAKRFCKPKAPKHPGAVLACLRAVKPKLNARCRKEVFRTQLAAARDYRNDAQLAQFCKADVERLCADDVDDQSTDRALDISLAPVVDVIGRHAVLAQDCLHENAVSVSFDCKQELFRQDVENAGDLRLSVSLLRLCMGEKQVFCADIEPGDANAMYCLEKHREDNGFGGDCRELVEESMQARAMDFRLDAPLREACAADVQRVCGLALSRLDTVQGIDGKVVRCLQDFRNELQAVECAEQVHRTLERSSSDVRFNYPLATDCAADRERLCPDEQPGSARVLRCLQEGRESLSFECRAALFDQEQEMAEDIDFKAPLKAACAGEISSLCGDVPHGHARVIRCLQEFIEDAAMGTECRARVEEDLVRSSSDYRLNFRLREACEADVAALCPDACKDASSRACGGRALRCLTDRSDEISSAACRKEVFYFEKMEVFDFRNDVILAEACRKDVDTFCKKVEPGEGRVYECLRSHRDKLSEACRKEELHTTIMQAQDVRLRPKLRKLCSQEIAVYCSEVKPGRGRIMQCLQQNLGQPDFGAGCAEQVAERELAMQLDWHEDFGVAAACAPDIAELCSEAQKRVHGKSQVLKCLVSHLDELDDRCQDEIGRATRMALWEYTPGAALTECCDSDVHSTCAEAAANHKRGVFTIGAVGRCLAKRLAAGELQNRECRSLVLAAAPADSRAMVAASAAQSVLKSKVKELQAKAHDAAVANQALVDAKLVDPDAQGASVITLSGWIAAAAMAAMAMVVVIGVYAGVRRLVAPSRPYTIVSTRDGDA